MRLSPEIKHMSLRRHCVEAPKFNLRAKNQKKLVTASQSIALACGERYQIYALDKGFSQRNVFEIRRRSWLRDMRSAFILTLDALSQTAS